MIAIRVTITNPHSSTPTGRVISSSFDSPVAPFEGVKKDVGSSGIFGESA